MPWLKVSLAIKTVYSHVTVTSGTIISTKRDPAIRSTDCVPFWVVWFLAFKVFTLIKDLEIISCNKFETSVAQGHLWFRFILLFLDQVRHYKYEAIVVFLATNWLFCCIRPTSLSGCFSCTLFDALKNKINFPWTASFHSYAVILPLITRTYH